jgi:hypothetical protein
MATMNHRKFLIASALAAPLSATAVNSGVPIESIAEEAYIWGEPLVL